MTPPQPVSGAAATPKVWRPTIGGAAKTATVNAKGNFTLANTIKCPGTGPACTLAAKLTIKGTKLGEIKQTIAAAKTAKLKGKLSAKALRALRSKGEFRVLLKVRVTRGDLVLAQSIEVTLKISKRKH